MAIDTFIGVGENIHCTRIYKVGGKYVKVQEDGRAVVNYTSEGEDRSLPIPEEFTKNADWEAGKVKHCAAAIWQGNYGGDACKTAGVEYLQSEARRQEKCGATYLDVNVDEFSTDVEERVALMKWTVGVVQEASSLPVSVDSSNIDILRSGLAACDASHGKPMVNSVSLEREDAIAVAAEFGAVVVASAAGRSDLPTTTEGRMGNLKELMPKLEAVGLKLSEIHIDPLVFPISTDSTNGKNFLESVEAVRAEYGPEIHVVAGLSNISFGMPKRSLINKAFALLATDVGADGGIVDPIHINVESLNAVDRESESFRLAKDLLLGDDDFGMNYIMACREGSI